MNIYEILFYAGIGIGNLFILTEWAKKGFWEVGLEGIRNKKAMLGWFIGVSTFVAGGIMYRLNGFNPINNYDGVVLVYAIPILIALFVRKTMPSGQRQFDMAKTRMNFWMNSQYYQPSKILESGNELAEFSRARQTVEMFKKAMIPYQNETSLQGRLNLAIGYEELGMMHRLMNNWKEAGDSYEKSLLLYRELVRDYPNTAEVHAGLSMTLFRKAEMTHALGSFEEAIKGYQESQQEGTDTDTENDIRLTKSLIEKAKIRQN